MSKQKYFYYHDEVNDDFANNGIASKPTPADYEYFPKSLIYRFFQPIVYYLFFFVFSLMYICGAGFPKRNAKIVKERNDKKRGYFVFGNHTNWIADALAQPMTSFPRMTYTIVHPDAISIRFFGYLIRMIGVLPRPSSRLTFTRFNEAIERIIENGNSVMIFPEAHIWPKYHKIRNFPDVSFYYPVKLNAPSYARTTVYKKKFDGHTTAVIYYDGPFYPNTGLPFKEAQKDLRDRIYNQMVERTKNAELDCDYHYIKIDHEFHESHEFHE